VEFFGNGTLMARLLRLDFTTANTVRVDQSDTVLGTFPRDRVFTLAIDFELIPPSGIARMKLFGAGASGELEYTPAHTAMVTQTFREAHFWIEGQDTGRFNLDNIIVTRTK
jgi:hypothetical protein